MIEDYIHKKFRYGAFRTEIYFFRITSLQYVPYLGQIHDTYGTYVCMRRICPRAGTVKKYSPTGLYFGPYYFTEFSEGAPEENSVK